MSKNKLLDALKLKIGDDKKIIHAITKIEREKRLSSEEFLKVHDVLRKEGPFVKYQNPNSWNKEML
ncbi:MAG: hypothetical protein ACXVAJ_08540 [Parachlamydiaceae bacterium]|jgi:Flp pilus assembly CpaE family ATPase